MEIVNMIEDLPPEGRVLDLGCGEGRNSIYLAEFGFKVDAVDNSKAGIAKLCTMAKANNLKINAQLCDVRKYSFHATYDLIVAHGLFHLIERDDWQKIIHNMKQFTNPNGINVVVVFTNIIPPPDDLRDLCVGLFEEEELFNLYEDWNILMKNSYILKDEHPGGIRHVHPVNKIVAKKTSNKRF